MKSPPKNTGKTKALFQPWKNVNTLQKGLSDRNAKKGHWHLAKDTVLGDNHRKKLCWLPERF
jgi:hypothetical protein